MPINKRALRVFVPVLAFLCLPISGRVEAGTYDKAYFGAVWLASPAKVKEVVRGRLVEYKKRLSPWDVPYVRELGHLYFLEDKDFSRMVAVLPIRGGGRERTEYYFFRNRLSMVRVSYETDNASFQGLLESLVVDYGKPRKETSKSPDDLFVQHTFNLPRLVIEVSYHPYKVKGGWACRNLVLRIVHKDYIERVAGYHESLKAKYGKE